MSRPEQRAGTRVGTALTWRLGLPAEVSMLFFNAYAGGNSLVEGVLALTDF